MMIRPLFTLAAFSLLAFTLTAGDLHAELDETARVIAITGDPAPDGNGVFSSGFRSFDAPALNDAGYIAFRSDLTDTDSGGNSDESGMFSGNGFSPLMQVFRGGHTVPDGNGEFSTFINNYGINAAGQVASLSFLTNTAGGFDDYTGVYRGDGMSAPIQIARADNPVPNDDGTYSYLSAPSINDSGWLAFDSFVGDAPGRSAGVFIANDTMAFEIVRDGDAAPDGDGQFNGFFAPAINNSGQVLFNAFLDGTANTSGLFVGDGSSATVRIVRAGQAAPDANGVFENFSAGSFNEAGQAAFSATLTNTADPDNDDEGVFIGDGSTGPTQLARAGDAAPDGNGAFSEFSTPVALNNHGQVAFVANLTGTSGGETDDTGLFVADPITGPTQIARAGDAAPDGNGVFDSFLFGESTPVAINDAGQIAFGAVITGSDFGGFSDGGIFLYDPVMGLIQIVRSGDAFLGSTIETVDFAGSVAQGGTERSGLNEHGQVAFTFFLEDGRDGVALWTIPEPTTAALLTLSTLLLYRRRR